MKYKNTKTNFVFETECEVQGLDWVKLEEVPAKTEEENTKEPKKTKRKN